MPVTEAKNLAQFKQLIAGKNTVVDFTATWCPPCQRIKPFFESLSTKYPKVQFLKVDVDENSETSEEYNISAMPTFKVFVNGQSKDELVGANTAQLEAMVKKYA